MDTNKEKRCPDCYRKLRLKNGAIFCKCGYKPSANLKKQIKHHRDCSWYHSTTNACDCGASADQTRSSSDE